MVMREAVAEHVQARQRALDAAASADAARVQLTVARADLARARDEEAKDLAAAAALYARAVRVLDPPNPIYDAARTQAALYLETVEDAMAPKPGPKKALPKK